MTAQFQRFAVVPLRRRRRQKGLKAGLLFGRHAGNETMGAIKLGSGDRLSGIEQRLVRIAKTITLLAVVWTALYAVALFGWQLFAWTRDGVWDSYPLSSAIRELQIYPTVTEYSTASVDSTRKDHSVVQRIIEVALEVPTIALLLMVLALLMSFYIWLTEFEKRQRDVPRH
jgi:hypothetical protein